MAAITLRSDEFFFENFRRTLDKYSKYYDKIMLVGDFNAEESEPCLSQFLYEYNARTLSRNILVLKMH